MIDYRFLSSSYISGLEFMDFQNSNFFDELRQTLAGSITEFKDGEKVFSDEPDNLFTVIERHTGFKNISLEILDYGNLAIDAGFINPGNAFDIPDIERYLSRSNATLNRWFKSNKANMLKGTIDFRTGKVGGAYADLPFTLYVNRNLKEYLSNKELAKLNIDAADALAAFIIHELGHAFGGIMMIHQTVEDSIIMRGAIAFLTGQAKFEDRVTVLKEASSLLDPENKLEASTIEELAELADPNSYYVFFTKVAGTRNTRRSLSLGVPVMNSEVVADAYSVRMGCGKPLVYALVALQKTYKRSTKRTYNWVIIFSFVFGGLPTMYVVLGFIIVCHFLGLAFGLSPSEYNTDYRRMQDILSEMISKLKNDKTLSSVEQRKVLNQITKIQEVLKDNKPLLEDTAFQRFMLWVTHGSDGKFINIEHYTRLVTDHSVNATGFRIANL